MCCNKKERKKKLQCHREKGGDIWQMGKKESFNRREKGGMKVR
jgi:hypothetical protein